MKRFNDMHRFELLVIVVLSLIDLHRAFRNLIVM